MTVNDFLQDRQGAQFRDVAQLPEFQQVLDFLDTPDRRRRMVESEIDHDRAPLAGVVRELEAQDWFERFLAGQDGHDTRRFRQAIGVAVRMLMANEGFVPAGSKGTLGQRVTNEPGTTTPGAYHNKQGSLSRWFTKAERYTLTATDVHQALRDIFTEETAAGRSSVDVRSGDLHAKLGGYPGRGHRMPVCCSAMKSEMQAGDSIIEAPPSGQGANLIIRYVLPR